MLMHLNADAIILFWVVGIISPGTPLCHFVRIEELICLLRRGVVGIGSNFDHAPPFACSVKTFAKANCPHRTPFLFAFLPAPMAADKMGLVQITTPFPSLEIFLHGTFGGAIIGIIFSGKFRTFPAPLKRKSGSPSARSHPNRQRFHRPYARSHRHQRRYPLDC